MYSITKVLWTNIFSYYLRTFVTA